jgi:hypothetical protein
VSTAKQRFVILTMSVATPTGTCTATYSNVFTADEPVTDLLMFEAVEEEFVDRHGREFANPSNRIIVFFHVGSA